KWLALILWLVVTIFALIGYVLARQSLRGIIAAGGPEPPPAVDAHHGVTPGDAEESGERVAATSPATPDAPEGSTPAPREVTPLDAKWARTLLYNWRRTNALLVLGALAVGGWYWLGA
ncbi:MAG: hypothetical protein IT429_20510, partial [Gemmataceae bacterium]|nr:hypothetical protein [Gemmataceae bacterium]